MLGLEQKKTSKSKTDQLGYVWFLGLLAPDTFGNGNFNCFCCKSYASIQHRMAIMGEFTRGCYTQSQQQQPRCV